MNGRKGKSQRASLGGKNGENFPKKLAMRSRLTRVGDNFSLNGLPSISKDWEDDFSLKYCYRGDENKYVTRNADLVISFPIISYLRKLWNNM